MSIIAHSWFDSLYFFTFKLNLIEFFFLQLNEIREVVDGELGFVTSQDKDLKPHEQVLTF